MDQIRFDFLGSVNGSNSRGNNAHAKATEPHDAFAQILDKQLTRRADSSPDRRSTESISRSDASDRADGARPQAPKRRDSKPTTSVQAKTKPDTAAAKPAPKAKQPEKSATESDSCAKPAAKPQQDDADETTEAATAGGQTATESTTAGDPTETESKPDTPGDADPQQQDDGTEQQPAGDGTDQTETVAAEANLSLLTMLAIPLPLQTITADTNVDAAAEDTAFAGGGNPTAALQAALAASLAGKLDVAATADTNQQGQPNAGGLKFGAIFNPGTVQPDKAATDAVAALQDAAEDLAQASDPLAEPAPNSNGSKPRDSEASKPTKVRDAGEAKATAATITDQNGKAPAAVVQPMNRPAAVTWSGTNMRNEISQSMGVQADNSFATEDAEFTNWSQVLGSSAAGLGSTLSARQSAFMAQLKQNLQILPPHEQIAVQIRDAMQNGNSRLTVALHPVELGRVEVKLDIDKDKNVSATVIVDRPATLDLLRNDAKALERALQDAGLQTGSGSLSFNLRDSNGQNGNAQNGTGTGGGSGTGGSGSDAKAETVRADVVATADGYVDLET